VLLYNIVNGVVDEHTYHADIPVLGNPCAYTQNYIPVYGIFDTNALSKYITVVVINSGYVHPLATFINT
jgi:hypothetical protein